MRYIKIISQIVLIKLPIVDIKIVQKPKTSNYSCLYDEKLQAPLLSDELQVFKCATSHHVECRTDRGHVRDATHDAFFDTLDPTLYA